MATKVRKDILEQPVEEAQPVDTLSVEGEIVEASIVPIGTDDELEIVKTTNLLVADVPKMKFYLGSIELNKPEDLPFVATAIGNQLAQIIAAQHMYEILERKDRKLGLIQVYHPKVEAWQCLAGLLGVTPAVERVDLIQSGERPGYLASVVVVRADGRIICRGEGYCSFAEGFWSSQPEFAVRAMAQTRGVARAMRNGWAYIMKMAGYEPTPLEEMPRDNVDDFQVARGVQGTPANVQNPVSVTPIVPPDAPIAAQVTPDVSDAVFSMIERLENFALSLGFNAESMDAILNGVLLEDEVPVLEDEGAFKTAIWMAKMNGKNPTRDELVAELKAEDGTPPWEETKE